MTKSTTEKDDRRFAVEQAASVARSGPNIDIMSLAADIYAFVTGDVARPTSAPTTTTSIPTADTGAQQSAEGSGSPAPSGMADEGNSAAAAAANGAAAQDAANQAATGDAQAASGPLSEEQVKVLQSKCMALSQRDGPSALKAEFEKVGAGKWSEVSEDKRPVLLANLEAMGL